MRAGPSERVVHECLVRRAGGRQEWVEVPREGMAPRLGPGDAICGGRSRLASVPAGPPELPPVRLPRADEAGGPGGSGA